MTKREKDKALTDEQRAEALVEALFDDMADRSGFDTGNIDTATLTEWREDWKRRILTTMTTPLTDAEAGAVQAVSEVERLRRAVERADALLDWLTVNDSLSDDGRKKAHSMRRALAKHIDSDAPTARVFTEAEVRKAAKAESGYHAGVVSRILQRLGLTLD